jgi:hypothetical protein
VTQVWKGKRKRDVAVVVQRANTSCGHTFDLDEAYLVYADRGRRELEASSCTRVQRLAEATADLAVLGKGRNPD